MRVDIEFHRTGKADKLDWLYVTDKDCLFVFDMPHSAINGKVFSNTWCALYPTHDGKRETVTLWIKKAYAWDGCSCAPDFKGTLEGSLPHDVIYQFVEEIAAALCMTVKEVLSFADTVFNKVMVFFKTDTCIRLIYYVAVCKVGYAFNRINKWRNR